MKSIFGKSLTSCAAAAIALLACGSADASFFSGTGGSTSAAALSGGVFEGFDSSTAGLYSSITIGNVTYKGVDADLTIGSDYNGSYNTSGGQSIYNDFDYVPMSFRFDFGAAVSAFGFNWGASDNTWTLAAYDSGGTLIESHAIAATHGSNAGDYFGISAAGIKYATLIDTLDNNSTGDYVFIDDFGYVGAVPEPASLAMWGLGAMGACVYVRRRKRSQA